MFFFLLLSCFEHWSFHFELALLLFFSFPMRKLSNWQLWQSQSDLNEHVGNVMQGCCIAVFMIFFFSNIILFYLLRYFTYKKGKLDFLPQCFHKNSPQNQPQQSRKSPAKFRRDWKTKQKMTRQHRDKTQPHRRVRSLPLLMFLLPWKVFFVFLWIYLFM